MEKMGLKSQRKHEPQSSPLKTEQQETPQINDFQKMQKFKNYWYVSLIKIVRLNNEVK